MLCALDVDAAVRGPLALSTVLAQRFQVPMDALYASAPLQARGGRAERVRSLIAEHSARERMEALLAPFATTARIAPFITRGATSTVILSHSQAHGADLIVLGDSGEVRLRDGRRRLSASVASQAGCAVLTVPTKTPACAMRRILLPVASESSAAAATGWAISLAHRFEARVSLVSVRPRVGFWGTLTGSPRQGARAAAEHARLGAAGVQTRSERLECADARGLMQLGESGKFDLVVLGLDEASDGQAHLLARRLRQRAAVPVLSVRARPTILNVPRRRPLRGSDHLWASYEK